MPAQTDAWQRDGGAAGERRTLPEDLEAELTDPGRTGAGHNPEIRAGEAPGGIAGHLIVRTARTEASVGCRRPTSDQATSCPCRPVLGVINLPQVKVRCIGIS